LKSIAILLEDFGGKDLVAELLEEAHALLQEKNDICIVGFVQNIAFQYFPPKFAILHISELLSFYGSALATSLDTAEILLKCHQTKKYFYSPAHLWPHQKAKYIYSNHNLKLLTKNAKKLYKNNWDRDDVIECKDIIREIYERI
jgi:hypothetical protein